MKKPWLAALLNLFPFPLGLGWLYLGRRSTFYRSLPVTLLVLIVVSALLALACSIGAWTVYDIPAVVITGIVAHSILGGLAGAWSARRAWRFSLAVNARIRELYGLERVHLSPEQQTRVSDLVERKLSRQDERTGKVLDEAYRQGQLATPGCLVPLLSAMVIVGCLVALTV